MAFSLYHAAGMMLLQLAFLCVCVCVCLCVCVSVRVSVSVCVSVSVSDYHLGSKPFRNRSPVNFFCSQHSKQRPTLGAQDLLVDSVT